MKIGANLGDKFARPSVKSIYYQIFIRLRLPDRHEHMHWLRSACEAGDERACWRLREMREAWRERQEWRERHDWRDRDQEGNYGQQWRQDRY